MFELYPHQKEAAQRLKPGAILCGDVGTGKTLTGLYFYKSNFVDRRLIVITTAKKRDEGDWTDEAGLLGIDELTVDSWNNITKYKEVKGAFFIFDEQRLVGSGAWVKSFLKIAKVNKWIMLTGTPGDVWMDFVPIFIANGFYRNKTDFIEQHVEYDRFAKYPKVKKYHNQGKLNKLRRYILVRMTMERKTLRHRNYVETFYDKELYNYVTKKKWNPYLEKPIENASEYTQVCRRIVATSNGRIHEASWQLIHHRKIIVFYNYDYELDILVDLCEFLGLTYAQWNGHKHEYLPRGNHWVYLVNYAAGAEGWNCIETDTIMFYSPHYAWKTTEQAEGRIDRLNTKFVDLNYIYLTSKSPIDQAVIKANLSKKTFNESAWAKRGYQYG